MEKIIAKLEHVWDSEENTLRCGGSYSSMKLRKALGLAEEIEAYKEHPQYEKTTERIVMIVKMWRKALARHNAKELKFVEYDIDTGLPKKNNKIIDIH